MSKEWLSLRRYKLGINPFCECPICEWLDDNGLIADSVHHIVDLDQDWSKRLELSNLMSINSVHHSVITMINENKKRTDKKRKMKNVESVVTYLTNVIQNNRGEGL